MAARRYEIFPCEDIKFSRESSRGISLVYNKCYLFSYPDDDVTVGKFYATYLIQEYFRRFKARQKAQDQANEVQGNSTVALQVSVGD